MRRSLIIAGLSTAVLLPAVAGQQMLRARPALAPGQSITLAADSPQLQSAISIDDLSAELLKRLTHFNSLPIYGTADALGHDRLRAWTWTHISRTAVRLYQIKHDPRLIEAVLDGFRNYSAQTEVFSATDGFGWYTRDSRAGTVYREIPITGLIIAPIVEILRLASSDRILAAQLAERRVALLQTVERGIAGFDKHYREQNGLGFFVAEPSTEPGTDVWPLNLGSVYARPLLGLWQLTGNREYLREVTGIARTWRAAMTLTSDGGVGWPYTPLPSDPHHADGPQERLVKAAIGIEFPLAAYEAGIVLDRSEIDAIARAPLTTMLEYIDQTHVRVRKFVSPGSTQYLLPGSSEKIDALALAAWYVFTCQQPGLASSIDPVMFGADRQFYLHSAVALHGLSVRLALENDPSLCPGTGGPPNATQARAGNAAGAVASAATETGNTRSTLR